MRPADTKAGNGRDRIQTLCVNRRSLQLCRFTVWRRSATSACLKGLAYGRGLLLPRKGLKLSWQLIRCVHSKGYV